MEEDEGTENQKGHGTLSGQTNFGIKALGTDCL